MTEPTNNQPDGDRPDDFAVSESSMLEQAEDRLRHDSGDGNPLDVDSDVAETLIQLNNTFHQQQPELTGCVDRFEIRGVLGRGQFGTVYLAWDPRLNRDVALKVAGTRICNDPQLRKRFQREAELIGRLDHPGLVRVFEVGDFYGIPFYVMPRAAGTTLRTWINDRSEPIPVEEAVQIVVDVADAMQHGHDIGIIHRDLKPSNVMIRATEGGEHRWSVCVLDFGLAALADPSLRETEGGMLLGTPMYMSPEQAEGRRDEVGVASDQFSLSSLLYELLTGHAAFQADHLPEMALLFKTCSPTPPSTLRPACGADLDAICRKGLQRNPADRYASMADLANDLRRWRNGDPPLALTERSPLRSVKTWIRQPGRLGQLGLLLLPLSLLLIAKTQLWDAAANPSISQGSQTEASLLPTSTKQIVELGSEQLTASGTDVNIADLDRRLAEHVIALGGRVEVVAEDENYEVDSVEQLPAFPYDLLWIMMLVSANATDEFVAGLRGLKSLEGIDLYATSITDAACKDLATIESLKAVYVHQTKITDTGAAALLTLPKLEDINLAHTRITDSTLHLCGRHPKLQRLNAEETDITDAGFRSLADAPALTVIDVSFTNISDASFVAFSDRRDLREIAIAGTRITSKHFEIVMQQQRLHYLECSPEFFGEISESEFQKQRPLCEVRLR